MVTSAARLAAVVAALTIAACGGDARPAAPGVVRDEPLEHIHGVAGLEDGTVFVATHNGLFRAPPGDGRVEPVGEMRPDLMGFSVVSAKRFIASGHPDARDDRPPHVGLVESRDGGRSWTDVSLSGEADFHVLRASGDRVYGYDGAQGRLLVSSDGGRTWKPRRTAAPLIDLAIDPRDRDRIVAATERGLSLSRDAGRTFRTLDRGFVGLVGWAVGGELVRVDARGVVERSARVGAPWRRTGQAPAQPVALATAPGELLLGTADATVLSSADGGRTWRVRARSAA